MAEWQQVAALIVTAFAVIYVLRRLRRRTAEPESGACGGCSGCDKRLGDEPTKTLPIVDVDTLVASADQDVKRRS